MTEMIVLANSWRPPQGRCIAGIDTVAGEWVRPVPQGGGSIPEQSTRVKGRELALLDVVRLDLDTPRFDTKYQKENRAIRNWNWELVRKAEIGEVEDYIRTGPLLYGAGKAVKPDRLEKITPAFWTSLQLVRPSEVLFQRDPREGKQNRWKAVFPLPWQYELDITDPVATARLNRGETIGRRCIMTASLTAPYAPADGSKPPLCYKLIAAVIELG